MEELQAEKDQLAAEREENLKMLAELKALKEQLAGNVPYTPTPPATEGASSEDAAAELTFDEKVEVVAETAAEIAAEAAADADETAVAAETEAEKEPETETTEAAR